MREGVGSFLKKHGWERYTENVVFTISWAMLFLLAAAVLPGAVYEKYLVPGNPQDDAILLVAHPAFRDLEYRQTVLIAAPARFRNTALSPAFRQMGSVDHSKVAGGLFVAPV